MTPEIAFATPLALALVGAVLALAADALDRERMAALTSTALLLVAAAVAVVASATVTPETVWTVFAVGAGFSMATGVVMLFGALGVLASLSAPREGSTALAGLVALSAAALATLASSTDIVVMLLALETAALSAYALIALARTPRAHEAAMKYFVQGSIATALFVLGLAAALLAGVFVLADGRFGVADSGVNLSAATTAVALLLAAFAFKLGAFPFHAWAPDAYETAPPEVAAFLASAVKVGALVATYTLLTSVIANPDLIARTQWLVAGIAAASVVFGNLAALAQRSYARLLAYSGIAQVGYGLTAIVTGNGNAALLFATAYGCAAAGAFAAARAYERVRPEWDGSIAGMAGLSRRAPVVSAALAVLLFSLTGIPPLLGFWGKFLVFLSAAASPEWLWLVVVGLLGSVVSFGYYGRILRTLYFDEPSEAAIEDLEEQTGFPVADEAASAPRGLDPAGWVVVALALIVILLGLAPLAAGLARYVGIDPVGLFTLGPFGG